MMTVPPDTYQISLNIIEAIKQHPVLYCTEVKGVPVKLQDFKQKVWKHISDELGLDPTWVRLRWKNLRDTYCRILKCKSKTEEGIRRKKWIFEDSLSFVKYPCEVDYQPQCVELTKEYIQQINSSDVSAEGLLEQLEDRNEDYAEYLEVLEETSADPVVMETETIETLDNVNVEIAAEEEVVSEQDVDMDSYIQQIQSKYRKIRPKRLKTRHSSSPKTFSPNKIKKSSLKINKNKVNANNTDTVANPVANTVAVLEKNLPPSTSITLVKEPNSMKNNDINKQVHLTSEGKSIELFFDSMAQAVKKLPPKAQADIKMHICKLVTEAEVQYSGLSTTQSTQQFIAPPGMIPKLVLIPCNMIDNQNESKGNDDAKKYKEFVDIVTPQDRFLKNVKRDWKLLKRLLSSDRQYSDFDKLWGRPQVIPSTCDVLIIGGGAIGSSIAYWLKQKVYREEFSVVVVEKDPTYTKASTTLSVGGLRQQFSLEENIHMSLYGAEFLRNINEHLSIPGEPAIDVNFHPYGYLILATEAGAETLVQNSKLQNSLGAKNVVLTKEKLKYMFPWINTDGIAVGCLGLEKEGWFDPWSLLCAFKKKASYLGAQYVNAEIKTNDGETRTIKFALAIIAAGAFSGDVAELADIGTGENLLSVPLPVVPRKRYVYCFHCPDGPGLNTPLTIDPSGTYFRRDGLGGNFIGGKSPEPDEEPSVQNLDVDHEFFDNKVWPSLAHRVPAFENLKVKSSWAGYYEYNTFDENGIIGQHPYHLNVFLATGFSGHGIQKAPAVGRAISELILHNRFVTIDLSKLSFDRFLTSEPMREANVF
ncbi:FAD-dependent oxidoreductase domain-containing protein 1 [Trachymyrmex cornetzi]|uniref:FAD-dependent oxidoreductase domain-containing protein 1 n=1 Tax=Trachymyrmex cornetzi TaxID=471704 RepID=A0A195DZ65_9HYME|nr:FAD-dependent oxidoreductase domain-containing protein 1 [Trachymyrmex cornetzi]